MEGEHKEILTFKLGPTSNNQVLYFFGVSHTNNPKHPQFEQIQKLWTEFLNDSKGERIVFVEGRIQKTLSTYEESINQYGEGGGIQWLARQSDIEMLRPEPDDRKQRELLCGLYDTNDVAYTMIVQSLAGWFRHIRQSTFEEAINKSTERESKFSDIYKFVVDGSWFLNQHKKIFGEQSLEDKQFLDLISDPRRGDTLINNIVSSRTKIRNEFILLEIKKAWESQKSVFIVYGSGHLSALELELKKLINNNNL